MFGWFDGDRIVGAASMVPWRDSRIADLGVLTLSDSRGRGHGRAVVTTIADHVVAMGYVPQYRCQTDNLASVALARAAGFASFGLWEVVRSPRRLTRNAKRPPPVWGRAFRTGKVEPT